MMADTASASWLSLAALAKSCVAIGCCLTACRPGEGMAAAGLAATCAAVADIIWRCCAASSRCVGCGMRGAGASPCEELAELLAAIGRAVIGSTEGADTPVLSKAGPPGESKNCEGENAIVGESSTLGDAVPQIWLMALVVLSGPAGLPTAPLLPSRRLVLVGVRNVGTRGAPGRPGVPARMPKRPEKRPGESGSSASENEPCANSSSVPNAGTPRFGDVGTPVAPSILRRFSASAALSRAGDAARLRRGL